MTPRTRAFWWQVGTTIVIPPYLVLCGLTALFCKIGAAFEKEETP